ncbi:Kynureninase [Andreprevotia lacus DSM 23236]|jgi:kynureninase|uniref:Kynureninase n=1 Tax=Andreprevotia lacus DSM 23236 TaxID=1121001 RepID=A0A1W1XH37_9NEIS|nr:kynureninase [Andreprevotia lacus]SMC23092.1 Kynureninase [Andreprevotia lacus DSM 23236]
MLTRQHAQELDLNDPLAPLRAQFALPAGVIYLDGNSLGVQPAAAPQRMQQVLQQEWGQGLIASWNDAGWFALPRTLGNQLAPLIGAGDDEVVVTDTISVNLFKLLSAALSIQAQRAPGRKVIVSERANFPTDLYIAEGLIRQLDRGYTLRLIDDPAELPAALADDVAVVMLTHVNYRSGAMFDMAAETARIHAAGALALWDLAHSAGAVPVDLSAADADFAVGCTYKYLNGGPGSPAFLWVAPRWQQDFQQPLSGWWGHRTPFTMSPGYVPDDGVGRYLCGTQSILALSMVGVSLDIYAQTDMAALRRKSLALTDLFIALVEAQCGDLGVTLATPRDHAQRGSQVSFEFEHGYAVVQALIARGVIGDYREPRIMRFGFTPLYTRFVDVWDAAAQLADVLRTRDWDQPRFHARGAVT